MTQRTRKRWLNVLRFLVCGAALWFVVQGVTLDDRVTLRDGPTILKGTISDQSDGVTIVLADGSRRTIARDAIAVDEDGALQIAYGLRSAWTHSHKWLLLLAVFLHFPVIFPQALRFRWLLSAQGIDLSYRDCLKMSFAGNFLNFAAPFGSHGGDVFKAYFASLHTERKTEAVTTVILDRVIGLSSLILVVVAITVFSREESTLAQFRPYMLGVLTLGIIAVVAYLSPFLRRHVVPRSLLTRLPMFHQLQRIDAAARTLAGRRMMVVSAILLTIGLQGLAVVSYCVVALGLTLAIDFNNVLECVAYFYTGVVIQALPGPPQGLGTVELAYRYFFAFIGSPSQIVCMALIIRVVVLICALPGLLVTMTGSYRPKDIARFEETLATAESSTGAVLMKQRSTTKSDSLTPESADQQRPFAVS